MTTSAARTTSSVSGFGNASERSTPQLGHRLDDERVDVVGRRRAGRADGNPVLRPEAEEARSHLTATCVVDADEEHLGHLLQI